MSLAPHTTYHIRRDQTHANALAVAILGNAHHIHEFTANTAKVIQQAATAPPLPHPIHLHGHDFYVLAQAAGAQWNGDISTLKMDNPIRRDTATLPAQGYLVLAFESDNPGAWLSKCSFVDDACGDNANGW